jgi:hypothetical protein
VQGKGVKGDYVAANVFAAVIYDYSNQPEIDYKDNVPQLNPGILGPRRFQLPVS